jgi:hypothetical protein
MKVLNTFVKKDITIRMVVIEQMIKQPKVLSKDLTWYRVLGFFDDACRSICFNSSPSLGGLYAIEDYIVREK